MKQVIHRTSLLTANISASGSHKNTLPTSDPAIGLDSYGAAAISSDVLQRGETPSGTNQKRVIIEAVQNLHNTTTAMSYIDGTTPDLSGSFRIFLNPPVFDESRIMGWPLAVAWLRCPSLPDPPPEWQPLPAL